MVTTKGRRYPGLPDRQCAERFTGVHSFKSKRLETYYSNMLTVFQETQYSINIVTLPGQAKVSVWMAMSSERMYKHNINFVYSGFLLRVNLRGFTDECDLPQAHLDISMSGKSKMFIGNATSQEESTTAGTWPFLVIVGHC